MPFKIVRNDITKMNCDAIVNAARPSLLGGGGVDGAIHKAAGKGMLAECMKLRGCKAGEAKITGGYNLPCKYVIHTVGPVYCDGKHGEEELLRSCYRNSLNLALKYNCETVAFPLISSGAYGYPKDEALRVAINEIINFLFDNEMEVFIVVFDKSSFKIAQNLSADVREYIDANYVEENLHERLFWTTDIPLQNEYAPECIKEESNSTYLALGDILKTEDESFSEMLLRKIDESGMTDVQCYKKANISRKLFSKIRSDKYYRPSKVTVLSFAIALELSFDETNEMLKKAGFALSHSNKFDIIIEFFIKCGNYNIYEINEALFEFDQCLLGG